MLNVPVSATPSRHVSTTSAHQDALHMKSHRRPRIVKATTFIVSCALSSYSLLMMIDVYSCAVFGRHGYYEAKLGNHPVTEGRCERTQGAENM